MAVDLGGLRHRAEGPRAELGGGRGRRGRPSRARPRTRLETSRRAGRQLPPGNADPGRRAGGRRHLPRPPADAHAEGEAAAETGRRGSPRRSSRPPSTWSSARTTEHGRRDNELFTIGERTSSTSGTQPHYVVIRCSRCSTSRADPAARRPTPVPDPRQPPLNVVMVRDLGSLRQPPDGHRARVVRSSSRSAATGSTGATRRSWRPGRPPSRYRAT